MGGGSQDSRIYFRVAPCIAEGSGGSAQYGNPRESPPEVPGNQEFEELLDPNDNIKNVNNKKKENNPR